MGVGHQVSARADATLGLENLQVLGNGNAGQCGVYFPRGTATGAPGSGVWVADLRNVVVSGFALHQIWFRGGGVEGANPHQFITLHNVYAPGSASGYGLFLSGQVGQVSVTGNSQFEGAGRGVGTAVRINRECSDNLGNTIVSDAYCYDILFENTSFQLARIGCYIDRAFPVRFVGGHFEQLYYGVDVHATATVMVDGASFANASADGLGSGYCGRAGTNCVLMTEHCFVSLGDHSFIVAAGTNGVVRSRTNYEGNGAYTGSGQTTQLANAPALPLGQHVTAIVNAGPTPITTITSDLAPGEMVHLKAHGGAITFGTGGNITLGQAASIVVPPESIATFVRLDLGAWFLMSITTAESQTDPVVTMGTGGTIYHNGYTVFRVTNTAPVTGIGVVPGTFPGQRLTIINEAAAANTLSFAAAPGSNVADGSSSPIPGLTARTLVWDAFTSLWYRCS